MPSNDPPTGGPARQLAFAFVAALVAAAGGGVQALVPRLVGLTADTVWILTATGAAVSLVAALLGAAAGYLAGLRDASTDSLVVATLAFAVGAFLAHGVVVVGIALFALDISSGGPLVAASGMLTRSVPFVAGSIAGASLSLARDTNYSGSAPN
ncbi:hypothetical protein [Halobaculum limi]|uniref:hypothetical protein n=1 Tax=Halobaculum limi TaxID=3031916 RepID=UPI0024077532|nr:hypothetical protein [Halobaculum sp. YSMS11]